MMTSYDTNEQVHLTFDLWEKHGGRCVHVGIPESLFFFFLVLICLVFKLTGQYFI